MNRNTKLVLAALVAIVAVSGIGLWWFFSGDEPAEVSLETATKGLAATSSTMPVEGDATTIPSADGIDGTWSVDNTTGDFDYESATGTFAGFRVEEELATVGSATAVGRTGDVTGTIKIEDGTLTTTDISIDMGTITTNESRRDDKVRDALDPEQFPTATFILAEPIQLDDSARDGTQTTVTATGDLTIHGVTRKASFDLEAQLVDNSIVVVGKADIAFSDFDVAVPTAPMVLSVDDHGTIEMQLLFTRQ